MNKLVKAKRMRKALDVSMRVLVIALGGFAFTAFTLGLAYLIIGAWELGLGFIPIVVFVLALFLTFWSILDTKTEKILAEEGDTDG